MNQDLEIQGLRLHADHMLRVQSHMATMLRILMDRMVVHDQSKYSDDELDLITGKTKLNSTPYGTDEYRQALEGVKASVSEHYRHNSHHPEHYKDGVADMSLFDLLEMLADWKAAGEQNDGSIEKSFGVNESRYHVPSAIMVLLWNTARELGWTP